MGTQEDEPKLLVADAQGGNHIYDALTFIKERSIQIPDSTHFEDF